jgi:hypothetical protein
VCGKKSQVARLSQSTTHCSAIDYKSNREKCKQRLEARAGTENIVQNYLIKVSTNKQETKRKSLSVTFEVGGL